MSTSDVALVKQRVRGMALWAGVGAVLLLCFGYRSVFITADTPVLRVGTAILANSLKIGGWALVVAAVWLAVGRRTALAYDAAATALVGVGFLSGGAMWLAGGAGFQGLLFVIFGVVFVSAGRHSWLEYRYLQSVPVGPASADDATQPWPGGAAPEGPAPGSLPSRIMERTRAGARSSPVAADSVRTAVEPRSGVPPRADVASRPVTRLPVGSPPIPVAPPLIPVAPPPATDASPAGQPAPATPPSEDPPPEGYLAPWADQAIATPNHCADRVLRHSGNNRPILSDPGQQGDKKV